MCSKYAKEYADSFDSTTEDDARERWDEDVYNILARIRTHMTESPTPLYPLRCPECDSFKITVVFATSRSLECLACGKTYHIEDR